MIAVQTLVLTAGRGIAPLRVDTVYAGPREQMQSAKTYEPTVFETIKTDDLVTVANREDALRASVAMPLFTASLRAEGLDQAE